MCNGPFDCERTEHGRPSMLRCVGIVSMTHPCVLLWKVSVLTSLRWDLLLPNGVKMACKIVPTPLASDKPEMLFTRPRSYASSTSSKGFLRHKEDHNTAPLWYGSGFCLRFVMYIYKHEISKLKSEIRFEDLFFFTFLIALFQYESANSFAGPEKF